MNILHMKYAVEVAKVGSLNKASEVLLIAQPNISRSIKELEAELGITIFARSAKGMLLTYEGEEFISYATNILKQIEHVEKLYKTGSLKKQIFSISVPRASYIADAFVKFSKSLNSNAVEIIYKETNAQSAINNILQHDYKMGIIRYEKKHDKYFKKMLEEKDLCYEMVSEFRYCLIMNKENELCNKDSIENKDLESYIEIAHADTYMQTLPFIKIIKEEHINNIGRKIYVFERASQFELLAENKDAFMWVSPVPDNMLARYNLVQKKCIDNNEEYKDVLIYKNGYKLSELDKEFITQLCNSRRKYL